MDQAPKLVGEPLQFVGQQVETEQLDGNQAVAIGLVVLVATVGGFLFVVNLLPLLPLFLLMTPP